MQKIRAWSSSCLVFCAAEVSKKQAQWLWMSINIGCNDSIVSNEKLAAKLVSVKLTIDETYWELFTRYFVENYLSWSLLLLQIGDAIKCYNCTYSSMGSPDLTCMGPKVSDSHLITCNATETECVKSKATVSSKCRMRVFRLDRSQASKQVKNQEIKWLANLGEPEPNMNP